MARAHRPAARPATRRVILKDDAIDEIATQAPTDIEALNRLRSLPKGFGGSRFGGELIEAIGEALHDPEAYAPKIERDTSAGLACRRGRGRAAEGAAEGEGWRTPASPPSLIATDADLEKIASDDRADSAVLQGGRREAFGEDALKLKRGELALVLDGTRVRVVPVRRAAKVNA